MMRQNNDPIYQGARALAALCFLLLIFFQVLAANPFPYSDDWELVSHAIGTQPISWDWLWAQYVDHRIPIQKLIQVLLLQASSVDFRVLILANTVFAYLVTSLLLTSVRSYRGHASIGDVLFPLILMNPGFTPFNWGFSLQFLSSVLLSLCVLALLLRGMLHRRELTLFGSGLCALLLAFCGMNGAIFSAVISVTMLIYLHFARPIERADIAWAISGLFAVALVAVGVVFFSWRPSGASGLPEDMGFLDTTQSVLGNFFF